jgi:hypothetical protein
MPAYFKTIKIFKNSNKYIKAIMSINKYLITLFFLSSLSVFAQAVKRMEPPEKFCSKATDISKRFSEFVASKMKVSISSVTFVRTTYISTMGCEVTVDTAKGPQSCVGVDVYSDGKDFWVGGTCY